jgi:two-component system chemotaxis sensor kinase CheA
MVQRSLNGLLQGSRLLNFKTLEQITAKAISALAGHEPRILVEAVEEVIAFIEGIEEEPKRIGELLVRDGKISEKDLKEALSRQKPLGKILVEEEKVSEEDVLRALKKQDLMETAKQLRPAAAAEHEMRTMRIDERKVEHFDNIIGELLIARNTYEYLLYHLRGADGDLRSTVKQLKDNLHLISRLTNEMHHGVMSLRMIPIRNIFQKFSRVARDISRKQRKLIDLITDGEEIEIDKKVADMLTDPLVHIVRNACDHAIEQPAERKSAGKPEKGTVILRASQEGRNLTIRIIDDGKGIDRRRLYEKAKETGMNIPSSLDDPALLELIFVPGLSTKREVTDLSGRGVGMDVVKTTARALGGTVQVTSEEGKGTEITLSFPMAMGISAALLVEADQSSYAIPLDYIVETLKLPAHKLRKAAGSGLVFYYRGEVIPCRTARCAPRSHLQRQWWGLSP